MLKILLAIVLLLVPSISWATNYCTSSQACYTLPEGSGTTTADQSANGNNGAFLSSGHPAWSSTVPSFHTSGSAAFSTLYAAGDYIDCGAATSLNNLSALTVTAWVFATSDGGGNKGRIVDKGDNGGWQLAFDGTTNNDLNFGAAFSVTGLNVIASTALTLNAWHYVVLTWDGSTTAANVHIYIDNTEVSYGTQTNGSGSRTSDSTSHLVIANRLSDQARTWIGNLTQIGIFNSVLNSTQLTDIYNFGLKGASSVTQHSMMSVM